MLTQMVNVNVRNVSFIILLGRKIEARSEIKITRSHCNQRKQGSRLVCHLKQTHIVHKVRTALRRLAPGHHLLKRIGLGV